MKKIEVIFTLAILLAFAACSNDNEPGISSNGEPVELRLSSNMLSLTRAAYTSTQNTQIVAGQKVYAWIDEVITAGNNEYIHAWELTADGNGAFTAERKNYPLSGYPVNAYTVHGNFTGITAGTTTFPTSALTHTVAANQKAEADFAKSDLLYASGTNLARQVAAHPLTFSHLLAKVEVYLVAGTGTTDAELAAAQVTISNTIPTATVTLSKTAAPAVAVTTGAVQDIDCYMQSETDQTVTISSVAQNAHAFAQAVIVPQWVNTTQASGGDPVDFITVTIGTASYTAQVNKEFQAGNKYTYHVVVNKSGLSLSSTITAWTDGGTEVVSAK